jgi:O-antigen/teichoic acid export membrane protein
MQLLTKTASSVFWNIVANSSTQLANLLVFVLLARQLPLDDLGSVVFALLVANFFMIFVKEGISDFLVQRPDWDMDAVSTVYWIAVLGGLFLTLVCAFVVAPLFGLIYGDNLAVYLQALSPTIFLGAISIPSLAKARREFKFRLTAGRNFINGIITALVALVLAFMDMGAWSLILSRNVGALGAAALIMLAEPVRPRWTLVGGQAKALTAYTLPILSSRIAGFFAFKAADIFLMALLGPAPLAIYRVGTRIWDAITTLLVHPLVTVSISTFSRVAADRLGETFSRMTTVLIALCLPVYLGAAAIGTTVTVLLFGSNWRESGLVMSILCMAATPQLIRALVPAALKSLENTRPFSRFVAIDAVSSIAWAAVSAPFGPIALAVGVFFDPHSSLLLNRKVIERSLAISLTALVMKLVPFVASAAVMFAGAAAASAWLSGRVEPIVELGIVVPIGIVLYLAALRVIAADPTRRMVAELTPLVPSKLHFVLRMVRWFYGGQKSGTDGPNPM